MRSRTPVLLTTAAVAAALVAPGEAAAVKRFVGQTEQGRTINLTIGDDNLLLTARVNWITRRCAQSGARFQHITGFRRPFDEATPDFFRDAGPFTVRDRGGIRSRVRIVLAGRRTFDPADPAAESWSGVLRATVVVRRRGRVIDRCRLRPIDWTAMLAP
jgi:hypothetical protein